MLSKAEEVMEALKQCENIPEASNVIKLQAKPTTYIDLDLLTKICDQNSLTSVANKVGVSVRTLAKYRKLAYQYLPDYRQSCLERFPDYEEKKQRAAVLASQGVKVKRIFPDPPPFTQVEVNILTEIGNLYKSKIQGKKITDEQVVQVLEANCKN